jgi:hypothetical protein
MRLSILFALAATVVLAAFTGIAPAADYKSTVEEHWLRMLSPEEQLDYGYIHPTLDAAGAVDGNRHENWAFYTGKRHPEASCLYPHLMPACHDADNPGMGNDLEDRQWAKRHRVVIVTDGIHWSVRHIRRPGTSARGGPGRTAGLSHLVPCPRRPAALTTRKTSRREAGEVFLGAAELVREQRDASPSAPASSAPPPFGADGAEPGAEGRLPGQHPV